tara:strand:- start:333 stop:608 length:276 start_codon:yes stop_codon:yes gene_type:complete
MADIVTLGDVSTKDTGSGSQLKTGGRRKYNMPKKCVEMKMKPKSKGGQGMSKSAAIKACYPGMKKVEPKKVELKKVNPKKVKLKKVQLKGY